VFSPGALLDGRYEIVGPLGSGGMGHIYRARRSLLGDEVAVKIVNTTFDVPAATKQRFLRESRACAQLRHPNIVSILDFNIDPAGQPYLVMELLSGPSLREEIELHGAMAPDKAAAIVTSVAGALQLAHDRGITHRDLKPANIVAHRYETGERVYKVIDFGLASVKEASEETRLTGPAVFLGTIGYAAPEQLAGTHGDHRTDIYAAGVIAYELLTGRHPFASATRAELVSQTLTAVPKRPSHHRPQLSAEVDAAVMRALAKEPAERWSSINEFARALQTAVGAHTSVAPSAPDTSLLARYDIGALLGRGRLGSAIYRGTHRALGIPLAIRVLRRDEQSNWDAVRARFLVEARTLQVPHPNLSQVRDFGEDERVVFVITDFVSGRSLREELSEHAHLPWPRIASLLAQMLDATAALNAGGGFIVGVNPDMIRITTESNGRERLVMSTAGISSVGDVLATMREQELRGEEASERELPYMAPEVLLGRAPEPSADVFTAGVLAYEMATETLPFRAPSLPLLIGQMLQTRPASPETLNPTIPARAAAAIMRALAPDVAARFPDANAFGRELLER
jgi:serine/threonine protein kinase